MGRLKSAIRTHFPLEVVSPYSSEETRRTPPFVSLAMQRSGQHAVLGWLCHQFGNVVHFNNCSFRWNLRRYFVAPKNGRVVFYEKGEAPDTGLRNECSSNRSLAGVGSGYRLLYSFEDPDINDGRFRNLSVRYDPTFVIILRDPYNWIASIMGRKKDKGPIEKKIELWKRLAYQSVARTDYLSKSVVVVKFNLWVSSYEYRSSICETLGVDLMDDDVRSRVPDIGGGSSFDKKEFDGRADQMDVLGRWKCYADNDLYRRYTSDRELQDLALELFDMRNPLDESGY